MLIYGPELTGSLGGNITAKQDISTTSGDITIDAGSYSIFELTNTLTGTVTFDIENITVGQIIDIVGISGSQTINLSSSFTTDTFNKVGTNDYDGDSENHLQIQCIDDNTSDAILNYAIATYTSDTTI